MLIVRPAGDAVQRSRSGHDAQAAPNAALPSPSGPRQMPATCPAENLQAGFDRHLSKPIDPAAVLEAILSMCNGADDRF